MTCSPSCGRTPSDSLHHFHVPLQSGSSEILRRMNRPYTAEQYARRVRTMRQIFPDAAIGTDVIVGFPGETEAHFRETYELVAGPTPHLPPCLCLQRPPGNPRLEDGVEGSARGHRGPESPPARPRRPETAGFRRTVPRQRAARAALEATITRRPSDGAHRELHRGAGGSRRATHQPIRACTAGDRPSRRGMDRFAFACRRGPRSGLGCFRHEQ